MLHVTLRYFAGARAAAGVAEEPLSLDQGSTVSDAMALAAGQHGEGLAKVLAACSFLLDGVAVRDQSIALVDGARLDVLPPFAGG